MSRYGHSTRAHPGKDFRKYNTNDKPKFKVKKGASDKKEWAQRGQGAIKKAQTGITPLKRRLRSLARLLNSDQKIPADVKIGHEREMQALQYELVELMLDKSKHEMIGRYHMVRFFERQKATRNLKKAKKALESCEDEAQRGELRRKLQVAEVDVNYPQYYPHMTPYQSMWKKEQSSDGDVHYTPNDEQEDGAKGNIEIWRRVEAAMKNGNLEKLKDEVDEAKMQKIRNEVESFYKLSLKEDKAKSKASAGVNDEEEDETGVGFFE